MSTTPMNEVNEASGSETGLANEILSGNDNDNAPNDMDAENETDNSD